MKDKEDAFHVVQIGKESIIIRVPKFIMPALMIVLMPKLMNGMVKMPQLNGMMVKKAAGIMMTKNPAGMSLIPTHHQTVVWMLRTTGIDLPGWTSSISRMGTSMPTHQ
jgi:hypothetical protein